MHDQQVVNTPIAAQAERRKPSVAVLMQWLAVLALVYLLLVAVGLLSRGFTEVSGGAEGAERIFAFASNPVMGVIVGVLATALVQSSSVVTSVIVGLVAGGLPVAVAIPMIMGSNMGTTVTNTIVSLGNLRDDKAFNRSFGASVVHDFFNLYSILIFLPIEIVFQPLERMAAAAARLFEGAGDHSIRDLNFLRMATRPAVNTLRDGFATLPEAVSGIAMIVVGIGLVILSVYLLNKMLKAAMTGRAKRLFDSAVGRNAGLALLFGAIVTILVQSSTLTTVLIVPMAGAGLFTLVQVFPFTLGANVGTTITALLAATAVDGAYQFFALQIALVHVFYNAIGVALFFFVPWLRVLPLKSAQMLADSTERTRWVVPAYILGVFAVLPGLVLGGQYLLDGRSATVLEAEADDSYEEAVADTEATELAIE